MRAEIKEFITKSNSIIHGKDKEMLLALCCFFSKGHLLIEDIPGVGKTSFAKLLAKLVGLKLSRIQFTSDLMPSDIIGAQVYNQQKGQIDFLPGPIFSEIVLADEINRSSSKSQSALLEAMEEYQVTVDHKTYKLDSNFFVIATQNPRDQLGTNPLPESQLDRFMMKIKIGYPSIEDEKKIILNDNRDELIEKSHNIFNTSQISEMKKGIHDVYVSDKLASYVMELIQTSRSQPIYLGLSPRAGIDIIKAAKAHAYFRGDKQVLPDDVQFIFPAVSGHRLTKSQQSDIQQEYQIASQLMKNVSI